MQHVLLSGCDCNTVGTISGSTSCADETGDSCSCSGTDGYSGGLSGKCDDCLDGWYWTSSDSTCNSKFFSHLHHILYERKNYSA